MLLNTEPGFRTKNIMNVNLVYESKDFSSYTYESMQQRRQRVMQLDNELNACPLLNCTNLAMKISLLLPLVQTI